MTLVSGDTLTAPGPTFVDLRTDASSMPWPPAPPGSPQPTVVAVPRAWSPDGTKLLLGLWQDYATRDLQGYAIVPLPYPGLLPSILGTIQQLPSDGLPAALVVHPEGLPYGPSPASVRPFWPPASGPQALIQDADGTGVYDFTKQQQIPLVEASRVAVASAPIDVAAQTGQAFAWAVQCFGLAETVCRAELRRLSLATGAIDVVATADQPRVFAVSPDGKHIAFADDTNLYVKDLTP
jgi:hypothetical protein